MHEERGSLSMGSVERMYLDRAELSRIEQQYALEMHYMRYHFARQCVRGLVLDIACGCGYGTYMLTQKTPEVTKVIGVDVSSDAIDHANRHFKVDKNEFVCSSVESYTFEGNIDWLVSIETIEHLEKPEQLAAIARRQSIGSVLLTYPTRRTTHYNPYHLHDLQLADIERIFEASHRVSDQYQYHRDFKYVILERNTSG